MSAELRTHLIPFILVVLAIPLFGAVLSAGESPTPEWWPNMVAYLALGVVLFGCSSLYHMATGTPYEENLNKVDHFGIHMMIAGTATVHMRVLPAILAERVPLMMWLVWGLALIGMVYRLWRGEDVSKKIVMAIYVAMAALILPTLDFGGDIFAPAMLLTFAGMAVYAASVIFLFRYEERHAKWHLGVVAGYVLMGVPIVL